MGHLIDTPTKEQTCPYTRKYCAKRAAHINTLVEYYQRLAEKQRAVIFLPMVVTPPYV